MKNRLMLLGVVAVLALGLTAPAFGGANAVSNSAAAAKSTAQKALTKAKAAQKKAKKANKTAKAAQAAADGAQSTADDAQAAAAAAQATADSKYGSVQYTSATATASNQSDKTEFIFCPTGKRSVGGGYALAGDDNAAFVFFNAPYANNGWVVGANDNAGVNDAWSMTLYLNCIGS